jgi:hypothetical protein
MSDGDDESYVLEVGPRSDPPEKVGECEYHHWGGKRNEIYRVWSQTLREAKIKKKKDLKKKKKEMEPISRHCGNVNEYGHAWVH